MATSGFQEEVDGSQWQTCLDHIGQEARAYCGQCDVICCGICVTENHSSCDQLSNNQEVTDAIESEDQTLLETRLKANCSDIGYLLAEKKANLLNTTKETKETLHKMKNVKIRIIKFLEELEQETVRKFLMSQQEELDFIGKLETLKVDMDTLIVKLNGIDNAVKTALLIFKTKTKTLIKLSDKYLEQSEEEGSNKRTADDVVKEFIDETRHYCDRITVHVAELAGRFSMKEEGDVTCTIMGSCLIPESGSIFVTDWKNSKLKRLNASYKICESLKLPDKACDVCRTDIDELAITLTFKQQVQFISIKDKMSLGNSFSVGECCRSISYFDNKVIVLCGGFEREEQELTCNNVGKAKLYTKSGELLQVLSTDNKQLPLFNYPTHVIARRPFESIYISDEKNGIAAFTKFGEFIKRIIYPEIQYPTGMYRGHGCWLYVACHDTNRIFLADTNGKEARVLLTKEDGVIKPLTPCFDKSRSKLLVGMQRNDDVLVFNVRKYIEV